MSIAAHRWLMTAVNTRLERVAFRAEPGAGEVVVGIAGCGVCHTDLGFLYDGVRTNHPLPLALGHEISGHVVAAGAGAERLRARRSRPRSSHSPSSMAFRRLNGLYSNVRALPPASLLRTGCSCTGPTLSVVGFTTDKVEVRLSNLMAFDARAIGNWGCPPEYYPAALDLVLGGKVAIKPFVEAHPLDDINRVLPAVHDRAIKKRAVLVPAKQGVSR